MGGGAGRETTQWFLEIKAKILKLYPEFGKIIGGPKKNQRQPHQWNQEFKSLSPRDFRTFDWLKRKEL